MIHQRELQCPLHASCISSCILQLLQHLLVSLLFYHNCRQSSISQDRFISRTHIWNWAYSWLQVFMIHKYFIFFIKSIINWVLSMRFKKLRTAATLKQWVWRNMKQVLSYLNQFLKFPLWLFLRHVQASILNIKFLYWLFYCSW